MRILGFIFVIQLGGGIADLDQREYKRPIYDTKAFSDTLDSLFMGREQPQALTQKEVYKLRKMLRFLHLEDSVVLPLLNGAKLPDLRTFHNLGVSQVVKMMKEDPDKKKSFQKKVQEYVHEEKIRQREVPSYQKKVDGLTTEGYAGCALDYGAFVEPITDALYNIIRDLCIANDWSPLCYLLPVLDPPAMPDWGLSMIDAMGKIPPGISGGNIHWVGAYEMCDDIHVIYNNTNTALTEERVFHGQYCRLSLEMQEPANISLPLLLGVCVPNTCSETNVTSFINDNVVLGVILSLLLEMEITDVYCGQNTDLNSDRGMQATLGIILALVILILLSTIYDGFIRKPWLTKYIRLMPREVFVKCAKPENGKSVPVESYVVAESQPPPYNGDRNDISKSSTLEAQFSVRSNKSLIPSNIEEETQLGCADRVEMVFLAFSAYSHTRRIWTLTQKSDHIPVLNGIRVLSFGWIILGNTWFLGPIFADSWSSANLLHALRSYPQDWSFQAVLNTNFASDTFFVMSGLLATYWWLKWYAKRGKITCGMAAYYFLHKYWRLMPALMLTMAIYANGYPYIASGPLYPTEITDAEYCKQGSWWKNLLMVNNLADSDKPCLAWTFYVPIAFQLHLVAIVVLVPLVLKPVVGYVMLAAMYISHIGATAGVSSRLHDVDDIFKWFRDYFLAPWCRAGPFVIGMVIGKIMYEVRKSKKKFTMHPAAAVFGWLIALALILIPVYVTYDFMKEDGAVWDKSRWVAYDTLSRSSWGLGVAWIIFACDVGYGGIISAFLGHRLWIPFSRIMYPILLTHAVVITGSVYRGNRTLYIGFMEQIYRWFANIIMSFIVGWVFATIWHYPLSIGLEKAILCTNKFEWIKYGRHPREEVAELEKEYNKILHDNGENVCQPTSSSSSGYHETYSEKSQDNMAFSSSNDGLHKRLFTGTDKFDVYQKERPPTYAYTPSSDLSTPL